jgi:hypothetical protein
MSIENTNNTSHDKHYNVADRRFGIEAIRILEGIACLGIPEEHWELCRRNLNLAMAFKYTARLGEKDDPTKELDKASNFAFRARNKIWPWSPQNPSNCFYNTISPFNKPTKEPKMATAKKAPAKKPATKTAVKKVVKAPAKKPVAKKAK